ncbi:MAG TPA: DUF3298 and DUF4163 domain-containing protein [Clostridiaceae bacterium]|nr:DUF3298 and DUF4163 domain-containing protein [Clostridiaceae bacterium]
MKGSVRILVLFIVISLFINLFSGCGRSKQSNLETNPTVSGNSNSGNTTPSGNTSTVDTEPQPLKISYKVYRNVIKDDGTDLVYFRLSFPYIDNPENGKGIAAINDYYETYVNNFINTVVAEGKEVALEGKKNMQEAGLDFFPFAYVREASVSYNGNNLMSVLHIGYDNTGGAHPTNYWASETFDVKTGKKLALTDIFGLSKEKSLEKVYDVVLNQIKNDKEAEMYYFEDYEKGVKEYYSENDFFLDSDGIIFYYQTYAIGPYAAGIPSFKLPYEKAGDLAIKILPVKLTEDERDIIIKAGRLIEDNIDVFCNIYGLSMLPLEIPENIPEGQSLFPVKDVRFRTFSDLENYIRGIYVKSEADTLLSSVRYTDKDGKLHGDINQDAGVGYYVNWNEYRYEVSDISKNSATITIYTVDDSPAGKKDKIIKVKMLKENGLWLLEKMFS